MLATLLLSFGVPMILGGDELGRTQQGNNNAYCQDNEISWVDWSQPDTQLQDFASGSSPSASGTRCSAAAVSSPEPKRRNCAGSPRLERR